MRNKILLVFSIVFCQSVAVFSQPYRSALGIASEFTFKDYYATGASFRFFMGKHSAGEITALTGNSGYYISLLYQYGFPLDNAKRLHGYVGAGVFNIIYPRGTVGLEYRLPALPLTLAADWRPFYEWRVDDDITNSGLKHFGISLRYTLKN